MDPADIEQQLKRLLAAQVCVIMHGCPQVESAYRLKISQSDFSRIKRRKLHAYSASRLIRLIASQGYHVDIRLRQLKTRFGPDRETPTVTVTRYDRNDRVVTDADES